MKITFKLINEQHIDIMNEENKIGHIFTPSGTSHDKVDAIQVCGISQFFDAWGCGIFNDKNGCPKKDIQLLFEPDTQDNISKAMGSDVCFRCFYPKDKCRCWDLRVKKEGELFPQTPIWAKDEPLFQEDKCIMCERPNAIFFDEFLVTIFKTLACGSSRI